jgi:ribonuclease/clavin/mitogillin
LIGKRPPFTLLDTGQGFDEYIPILQSALESCRSADISPATPDISTIILSHRHQDHVNGLPGVLSLLRRLWEARGSPASYSPPSIYKIPLPSSSSDSHLRDVISSLSLDSFLPSASGSCAHDLEDGQKLPIDDDGASLEALHTPGHTVDSLCLFLHPSKSDPSSEVAIFTADTVLGGSTSVFEDLSTYLSSLHRLETTISGTSSPDTFTLYPGHGPVVDDGRQAIQIYIKHRLEREASILKILQTRGKAMTPMDIVKVLYKEIPKEMWKHAASGVVLHLKKLEEDGKVYHLGGEGMEGLWEVAR